MKNSFKKSILLPFMSLLIVGGLASCDNTGGGGNNVDDYGISTKLSGPKLINELHAKMMRDHRTYVRYAQYSNYTKASTSPRSIDQSATDSDKNVMFYSGKLVSKSTSYTREHVWACANSNGLYTHNSADGDHYVDSGAYYGAGSDLYSIRPCDYNVNEKRGNGKFYEFRDDETKYAIYENSTTLAFYSDREEDFGQKIEPTDQFKGDIVRILYYTYIHYSSIGDNSGYAEASRILGRLDLGDVFNGTYTKTEIYRLMLKWNELDPVDDTERLRNDTIEQIQGNRNPFVDHPEYMARCFDLDE